MLRSVIAISLIAVSLPARGQEKVDLYGDPLPAGADVRLGTTRFRHTAETLPFLQRQIAFADNKSIVSIFGNSVHFYDCDSGELLRKFNLDEEAVRLVQISPDRQSLVTMSFLQDQTARQPAYRTRFWKIGTVELLSTLDQTEQFTQSAFTSDERSFITTDGDIVKFWDVATGERLLTYELGIGESIWNLTVSPLENQLIAFTTAQNVYLWDWLSGAKPIVLTRDWPQFQSLLFSPTQHQLAVIAEGRQRVQIWDTVTLMLIQEFKSSAVHRLDLSVLGYTPDGRTLIGTRSADPKTDETGIVCWDLASGNVKQTLSARSGRPSQIVVSPDGKRMAIQAGCTHVWNLETGECLSKTLISHEGPVNSVVFSRDSKVVVTASEDATVRVWDVQTGRQLHKLPHKHLSWGYQAAISPDGTRIASLDSNLHIWDAQTGVELHSLKGHGPHGRWLRLAFAPDNDRLMTFGGDAQLRVWNVESGKLLAERDVWPQGFAPPTSSLNPATTPDLGHSLNDARFSGNAERLLLTIGALVHSFDTGTGRLIGQFSGDFFSSRAISPDGTRLLTLFNQRTRVPDQPADSIQWQYLVQIHDLPSGREIWHDIRPGTNFAGLSAFSPDGRLAAVAFRQPVAEIHVWDVETQQPLLVIENIPATVFNDPLAFSPDNRHLASAIADYSVLIWDLLEEGLPESMIASPEPQDSKVEEDSP